MKENSIGRYLYDYRTERKLSAQNLYEITGVSQPYLSQIENGDKTPSRKVVDKIARGIANNEGIDIKEIHNKLLKMAGYSEIKYVDSFFELLNTDTPSYNSVNIVKDGIAYQSKTDFPANDLFFHLTDEHNKKMYKSIILNDNDRKYINEMIKMYLLRKYEIKKYDRDNGVSQTDEDFSEIKSIIKDGE